MCLDVVKKWHLLLLLENYAETVSDTSVTFIKILKVQIKSQDLYILYIQ